MNAPDRYGDSFSSAYLCLAVLGCSDALNYVREYVV